MSRVDEIASAVNAELKSMVVQRLQVSAASALSEGLSSGSVRLNRRLSGNPFVGYAFGRIVEIYGPEQSGKTTLALHAIREAQKAGLVAAFIDAEHALDPKYAAAVGVDVDDLLLSQPDYGEQAIETARALLRNGVRCIVVDSVAALTPKSELEGESGDAPMGSLARLMGQAMRQLTGLTSKSQAVVIFLNQVRMKLGVVFGSPETTPGGKALKYFASYRLEVRSPRGGAESEKDLASGESVETGIGSKIKIVKNKLYPPFQSTSVHIVYGKGIDKLRDISGCLFDAYAPKEKYLSIGGRKFTDKQLRNGLARDGRLRQAALAMLRSQATDAEVVEEEEDGGEDT